VFIVSFLFSSASGVEPQQVYTPFRFFLFFFRGRAAATAAAGVVVRRRCARNRPDLMRLRMMSGEHEDRVALEASPSLVRCTHAYMYICVYILKDIHIYMYVCMYIYDHDVRVAIESSPSLVRCTHAYMYMHRIT